MPEPSSSTSSPQAIQVGPQPAGVQQAGTAGPLPLPAPPARHMHRTAPLDHAGMTAVIRGGGSVIHRGEVIAHEHLVPTDADLAAGDTEATAAVVDAIDAQIAALAAQRTRLAPAGPTPPPIPNPTPAGEDNPPKKGPGR